MDQYKERMKKCYLCREEIQGEVHVVQSIVPLREYPEHAVVEEGVEPTYIHAYPVCAQCHALKVLI